MTKQDNKTVISLKKASSLINKIIKMIEEKEYCIDIMQQNLAVIGLLKSTHHSLMEKHLTTCFKNAMETKNEKRKKEMINEIIRVSKMTNK